MVGCVWRDGLGAVRVASEADVDAVLDPGSLPETVHRCFAVRPAREAKVLWMCRRHQRALGATA